jgi:hypothetical protein
VPVWVAPLVAPAVDLSILGLLLGSRHLALAGVASAQLRPARRLLIFATQVTLALNVADPLVAGEYGKAAFDAVGPLLLIGWAEVGPDLMRALTTARRSTAATSDNGEPARAVFADEPTSGGQPERESFGQDTKVDGVPGPQCALTSTLQNGFSALHRRQLRPPAAARPHGRPRPCPVRQASTPLLGVEEQLGVLDEQFGVLEMGAVVGVGVENELCVGGVLLEQ